MYLLTLIGELLLLLLLFGNVNLCRFTTNLHHKRFIINITL